MKANNAWHFMWIICTTDKGAVTWDFQQSGMCYQQRLRSACTYGQSDQSLCSSLEYSLSVKLLTEHLLEVLSLKGGCTGSSESTLVKMSNCWKLHAMAQISSIIFIENLVNNIKFVVYCSQDWYFNVTSVCWVIFMLLLLSADFLLQN